MATRRFNYKDDWVLKDGNIGINSETPSEKFDTSNELNYTNLEVSGIATFTSCGGFDNTKFTTIKNTNITGGESGPLSGEIVVGVGQPLVVSTGATTGQGSIKSLKVSNTFTHPIGGTNDRPSAPKPGALYYNKDFRTIEYWDGNFWRQVDYTKTSDRGIFCGGYAPTTQDITFVNVSTKGNAVAFGELVTPMQYGGGCSDGTRGLFGGGRLGASPWTKYNVIQYLTIQSTGNTIDFGDLTEARRRVDATSSSTRGLWGSADGTPNNTNVIDYVEIQTLGNAKDFGDSTAAGYSRGCLSSSTRGVWFGGGDSFPELINMDYVTIASKGNSHIFGDMTVNRSNCAGGGFSNGVRGVIAGGYGKSPAYSLAENIDSITIASEGNAIDFGKLSATTRDYNGAQNIVRGLIAGGSNPSTYINVISQISLSTGGESEDFGDLAKPAKALVGLSGSHGGLGGF